MARRMADRSGTRDQVDMGLAVLASDESYIQHHYTTRTSILNVMANSEHTGINTQQLEGLVKFHMSQFPSYKQANMLKNEYQRIYKECLEQNYGGRKEDELSIDELTELKIEALMDVEALISEIMDDDIGIRKRTTIGTV